MSNVTITSLPVLTEMTDSDVIPVVNVGANQTQQISGASLKTYFGSGGSNIGNLSVTGSTISSTENFVAITANVSLPAETWTFGELSPGTSVLQAPLSDESMIGAVMFPGQNGQGFVTWVNIPVLGLSDTMAVISSNTVTVTTGFGLPSGNTWTFGTDGNITLPNTVNPSINYANGQPYGGSGGGANTGNFTFDGDDMLMPLVAQLNSGGIGNTNAAEFGTEVYSNGTAIYSSQIYMGAGTTEIRGIVDAAGAGLMYAGVEGAGFAGIVGMDPEVTSQYAIAVGTGNTILLGVTQPGGTLTTTEYTAGVGALNANGTINGLLASSSNVVISNGNTAGWSFGADGELTTPQGGRLGSAGKGWQGLDGGLGAPVSVTSFYANGFYAGCFTASPDGNVNITTYTGDGQQGSWAFDNTGNLTTSGNISATGNITGAYLFGNGSQLTGVTASIPSQTILPTIQTITAIPMVTGYLSGGEGGVTVTVANIIPVTEYGVIVTAGTVSQKYATGSLGTIPGTANITFTTGTSSAPFTVYAYVTSNAGTYYSNAVTGTSGLCLLAGTQIALSDGSHKAIQDITYTDKMLSWDFDLGCYAETTALWIKRSETGGQYNLLTFSDGTTLRTFDQHRIFNKQAGAFTYPMTAETPIGTVTVNEHGQEITLVDKQIIVDTIEYYNVITDRHMNLFSDGVLTSCRFNNIYPITNMKFVKDDRIMRTRTEFAQVQDRFFYGLRLAEQTTAVETVEWYVNRLLATEASAEVELAV